MKKIVGSVLLLAIALTIVFPVIAFASSSAPMTAKEMSATIGGQLPICEILGQLARSGCREAGGSWFTCLMTEAVTYVVCALS